jgi:hypothetical protein
MNRSRRLGTLLLVLVSGLLLGPAAGAAQGAAAAAAEVPPGGVVRWSAPGTAGCAFASGGEPWEPVGETCWYPVDLLHGEGVLEVVRWREGEREMVRVRVTGYPYEVQHIEIEDESQVFLSEEDLGRVERENARIGALWGRRGPRLFELPLHPPLEPLPEGGRFGARRFFNGEPRSPHTGADYSVPKGRPVLAAADGVVALTGDFFFSGKSVFLDHGDGLVTMYFHLSEVAVEEGERVARGRALGKVGSTGRSTAPHLHFGVRWRGERVDPRMLLEPGRAPAVGR